MVDMLQPPELVGLFSSTGHNFPCNKTRTRNLAVHICLKHLINPVLFVGPPTLMGISSPKIPLKNMWRLFDTFFILWFLVGEITKRV